MEPLLYTVISKQKLEKILESLYYCLELPVRVLNENGETIGGLGTSTSFCICFKKMLSHHSTPKDSCQYLHSQEGLRAMKLKEAYVFSCHANLNHIIFPLNRGNIQLGSILVGPFLVDSTNSDLVVDIAQRYSLNASEVLNLYETLASVSVISAEKAAQISNLLSNSFQFLFTAGNQHEKVYLPSFVQETMLYDSASERLNEDETERQLYPYRKERLFLRKVTEHDIASSMQLLDELLTELSSKSETVPDIFRFRMIELCSILSRLAVENGCGLQSSLELSADFQKTVSTLSSTKDLLRQFRKTSEAFIEAMHINTPRRSNEIMKNALLYIKQNYNRNLTLEETAGYVHLNPSYFSSLFKQTCGSSFKEYLNYVRVEESKHLLTNTNYSIIDIALSTGFENQSYFTKVFKKYTGLTPKQYRN